jgi:hypothetical protein
MIPLHDSYYLKEAMTVSERRYLKRNSTELFSGKIFGGYSTESNEFAFFLQTPNILPHAHKQIDIVLKKLA